MVEQDVTEPPPLVVLVQGPPGVGKTTLIRNLVSASTQVATQYSGCLHTGRHLTSVQCPQVCPIASSIRLSLPSDRAPWL